MSETKKQKKKFSVYDSVMNPKSIPSYTTRLGKKFKAISNTKEDKIEFFKMLGAIKTAGYKTRKAKGNLG